jgi:transposase
MQDRELYRRILGIENPWQVERVELKLEQGKVHVYLEHAPEAKWLCPECSAPSPFYDHQAERRWRRCRGRKRARDLPPCWRLWPLPG